MSPRGFHQLFDLPQVEVWLPSFTENGPDARGAGLGHLDKDAFMFVRDHGRRRVIVH